MGYNFKPCRHCGKPMGSYVRCMECNAPVDDTHLPPVEGDEMEQPEEKTDESDRPNP